MCGICGIFDAGHQLRAIGAMNRVQRHHGPDDEGYLYICSTTGEYKSAAGPDSAAAAQKVRYDEVDPAGYDLVLASRRLAILDLSPAGHMPMSYAQGRYWIVYNGEIYNYRELRAELEQLGHQFASGADTEVILAAYAEWGVDCLQRFNGMFGFALWDAGRRRLFCARDRMGVKPFYYFWDGATFVFASETKTVLEHPAVPRRANDQIIFDYLVLGQADHTERTFFEDINALPASHYLLFDAAQQTVTIDRWWNTAINPSVGDPNGPQNPRVYEEFAELLKDAIRLRLRSDVPVGSCLSGGLDSSSIVTLANQLLREEQVIPAELVGEHQKTFTARNAAAAIDEHPYSKLIVEQTGADEHLVLPTGEKLWEEIERCVWHWDEPVDSTSPYPQWNVMRLAKQNGVTVLLDGQGGDEILAGYYAYYQPYISQVRKQLGCTAALRASWDFVRVGGGTAFDTLLLSASYQMPYRARQLVHAVRPPRQLPGAGGSALQGWQIGDDFMTRNQARAWQPPADVDGDGLVGVLYRDLMSTNLPKLLRYEDRSSMAFSLETRLPFLDFRLVEMVFSLPLNYRIYQGWSKYILRRSLQNVLPPAIAWRRSKLGFPTPETDWMRAGSEQVRALLREGERSPAAAYVRPEALTQMAELPDAELANTPGLWRIINLVLWSRLYLQGALAPAERLAVAV